MRGVSVTASPEIVKSLQHNYTSNVFEVQPPNVNTFLAYVARTFYRDDESSLHGELPKDDYQQLFADMMQRYVQVLIALTLHKVPWVPPLRLLLLGMPRVR